MKEKGCGPGAMSRSGERDSQRARTRRVGGTQGACVVESAEFRGKLPVCMSPRPLCAALALLSLCAVAPAAEPTDDRVDFNYEIRPILSQKCFHCHGPDEAARKAKLRLDLREEALKERDDVRAIVPGDVAASELVVRILSHDDDEVMPPPKDGEPLTARERELLQKWVAQGAEYKEHWAWSKPRRAAIPGFRESGISGIREERGDATASRNPIDFFIRARLQAAGLAPSPEADRHTLIRRLSLDLIGLPPTPDEVAAFVGDTSPEFYEQAVDRLLASPHFGEKWARMWLDLARYADSTGYGSDKFRLNVWPWRDWVVRAFNDNKPYDQFTIEQLAGDLLPEEVESGNQEPRKAEQDAGKASLMASWIPDSKEERIVATGFNRNTMTNVEGGTIDEEYRVAAVKDRIATTAQTWMGLTMGCAQCHSHKFDPISHRDYYGFFAIFNQTEDSDREDEEPKLPLPTAEEKARMEQLKAEIAALEQKSKADAPELEAEQHEWEARMAAPTDWLALAPLEIRVPGLAALAAFPAGIRATLALEPSERSPEQREELRTFFQPLAPHWVALKKELEGKRAALGAIKPVALPILRELAADKRRATHVLNKGNYLAPGDAVEPALPASFGPGAPADRAPDRLAVAQWLVSPENPLTARVAVNRFWSQLFGTGFVETEEDFGTQGALPSHPELLDWLAVAFQSPKETSNAQRSTLNAQRSTLNAQLALGWDVKALLKLIVSSATYRQSSRVLPEHLEKDSRNRLLGHYPRRRLEAEAVRDQALALSGLLSHKIGGPSVYPPQPDGMWKVAFNGGQNTYPTSKGEDRYRRGLYTFWRRTMPYPSMNTFDAPSRESCTLRRLPTNTPLQAFVTLNDPCFVECAQALARRVVGEGRPEPDGQKGTASRLRWALSLVLARPATEQQVAALRTLFDAELASFQADPAAAAKLATSDTQPLPKDADPAELAAWTVVANVLLNLDGVLTKG